MKKIISILLAGTLMLSLMSGCNKKNGTTVEGSVSTTEDSNVSEVKIDIKTYAEEIKKSADELDSYMKDALEKGYVDQARVDEYNSVCARLEEIIANAENTQALKDELDIIKSNIAVMASQAVAPNEVVDSITSNKGNNVVVENSDENITETPKPLSNDMTSLIDNFTLLQNEASKEVEKGTISEEEYLNLIKEGTNLAVLKEEMEKLGESEDLNKRIGECKNRIYETAVKMGSELADIFQ